MFCERCGNQLPDKANFCNKCGTSIVKAIRPKETINDTQIQLNVKPTYKFGYMILPTLLTCIFFMLPILICIIILINDITFEKWIFALIFIIPFGIVILIAYIIETIQKKQYDNFNYDFYKTKISYRDSFINLSEKEIKYKYIREVSMKQNFIQRFFNLGDITLYTSAETGFASGIQIKNIENVQKIYKDIKAIINI